MFAEKKIIYIGAGVLAVLLLVVAVVAGSKGSKTRTTQEAAAKANPVSANAEQSLNEASAFVEKGELEEAKTSYKKILSENPDYENIEGVQQKLEELNMQMILTNVPSNKAVIHDVVTGDTLGKIAKNYGTTVELIKKNNNLKNDVIRIGQKLRIWTGQFNIHVDKSQNILMLKDGEEVLKVYHVSTGENNSTPVGSYKVTSKLKDPVWFNKGVVVPPESPANVLGSRWLGFDLPGYGIHGTIDPEAIGQQVTAGCVRMRNAEVEELYDIIPIGTQVSVVD